MDNRPYPQANIPNVSVQSLEMLGQGQMLPVDGQSAITFTKAKMGARAIFPDQRTCRSLDLKAELARHPNCSLASAATEMECKIRT
ncbi:hypothetical protein [Sphingobacterium mizutaii]|uniref:hypothetical protein n=1 Tax=Sphingobacterium mizutaii TaxID=1010 RepID=UPI0028A82A4E|nr:hypothetical protein [Sphingobacterium mizutaii]